MPNKLLTSYLLLTYTKQNDASTLILPNLESENV